MAWAVSMADQLVARFYDADRGGFRASDAAFHEELILNPVEFTDGVMPSANGIAARALLRLGRLLHHGRYLETAEQTMIAGRRIVSKHPAAAPVLLSALIESQTLPVTIFLAGTGGCPPEDAMTALADAHRGPAVATVKLGDVGLGELLAGYLPAVHHMAPMNNRTTAYVCIGENCKAPETDPQRVADLLTAPRGPSK